MNPILTLEPDARLQLRWSDVPTEQQLRTAKAIPGARAIQNGVEWGWWQRTAAEIVSRLGASYNTEIFMPAGDAYGPEGWTWTDPDARVEWRSPTPPRPHQLAFKAWRRGAGMDGLWHPGCLLEAGLGTGKSLSSLEEMLELTVHRPRARVLVLCLNSLIETTWATQAAQHAPGLPCVTLNGPRKSRMNIFHELDMPPGTYPILAIHSIEDLPGYGKELANYEWDMIVIDETSMFRTAGAKRTGRLTGYQARPLTAPFRLGLSGLPMIKQATDLYPLLRWLGAPVGNKQDYLERFMVQVPNTHELKLADEAGLRSLLDAWRFQVPKGAVLRIPRSWHYERIQLAPWQRKLYKDVQRELAQRDAEELASTRLEELMRLAKVTAGFDETSYRPDNAKLDHLVNKVAPRFGDEQAIIWVRFREEAIGVIQRLPYAVAFTGALDAEANRSAYLDFTEGRAQFFVSTLSKGARGLNLPMARHMVYLTQDFDTDLIVQSRERNVRLTTLHENLTVTIVEAEDSIDQKVSEVVGDDVRAAARLTSLDVEEVLGR